MPTYEYLCEKCGHEFEASQSMYRAAAESLPGGALRREKMGSWQGEKANWRRRGPAVQRRWFLYHRLPQRRLQAGCKKRIHPGQDRGQTTCRQAGKEMTRSRFACALAAGLIPFLAAARRAAAFVPVRTPAASRASLWFRSRQIIRRFTGGPISRPIRR